MPKPLSFTRHIQPILQRVLCYQWVLELGRRGHGPFTGFGDFSTRWEQFADPSKGQAHGRQFAFGMLKDPSKAGDPTDPEFGMTPRLFSNDYATAKNHVLRPTVTQYTILQRWAAGEFVNDLKKPSKRDELLPDELGRVGLEACSGGPFYPDIEVGAVMADASTYSEAFRVDADGHEPGQLIAGNAVP